MAQRRMMQKFAKWHIWLGWLIGVPLLMWSVSGLVMVAKPLDEVRGNHLRKTAAPAALPADTSIAITLPSASTKPVLSVTTKVERGEPVTRIAYIDGTSDRFAADGRPMGPLSEVEARLMVAEEIKGGDRISGTTKFEADDVPLDFREPMPVWQVRLNDGTNVYVGVETGEIEAVRTRWWRTFDLMWGLHIMDLRDREDTHHPILILFAALAALGTLLGCVLMFRKRKARVTA